MLFQQKNIIYNKHEFFLNGIKLEKVLKYKYLGNIIETFGKLNSSFTELSKKVLFSIFKYLSSLERVSIKIYKKLFESLVKPVLMYNSEIWYMDFHEKISNAFNRAQNNDLNNFDMLSFIDKSPTEKINLRFCKYVLGLSKQSVNIAARAELAQYPVDVFIKVQSLKCLARISSDGNNPLLMDAFSFSKSLHSVGTYSWFSYVENICKFDNIDINIIQDNNNSHKNS